MKILIGCEESQGVAKAFREAGFEAYSCDLKPCSGEHPEWHLQMDVFAAIELIKPKLAILHPPCCDLAVSGAAHFAKKIADGRQQRSIDFFMACVNADVEFMAIENPIGIMSSKYRKPDQIIEPYYFGDPMKKPTCLWLKGLPTLKYDSASMVKPELITMTSKKTGRVRTYSKWEYEASCNQKDRKAIRSKTFAGIANAMAKQWGGFIKGEFAIEPQMKLFAA